MQIFFFISSAFCFFLCARLPFFNHSYVIAYVNKRKETIKYIKRKQQLTVGSIYEL